MAARSQRRSIQKLLGQTNKYEKVKTKQNRQSFKFDINLNDLSC